MEGFTYIGLIKIFTLHVGIVTLNTEMDARSKDLIGTVPTLTGIDRAASFLTMLRR